MLFIIVCFHRHKFSSAFGSWLVFIYFFFFSCSDYWKSVSQFLLVVFWSHSFRFLTPCQSSFLIAVESTRCDCSCSRCSSPKPHLYVILWKLSGNYCSLHLVCPHWICFSPVKRMVRITSGLVFLWVNVVFGVSAVANISSVPLPASISIVIMSEVLVNSCQSHIRTMPGRLV